MTAPTPAELIALVRHARETGWADDWPFYDALLSVLEGRGSGTEQAELIEKLRRNASYFVGLQIGRDRTKPLRVGEVIDLEMLLTDAANALALASSPSSVGTGAGRDVTEHPIWKLTARLDEALREIMDRTDSFHVTGIASASTWLTAEIRGFLAATAPQPYAAPAPDVKARYYELLFAVSRKYPGESRHETALRYIRQAETPNSPPSSSSPASTEGQ